MIATPMIHADGTIDAVVAAPVETFVDAALLSLYLPVTTPIAKLAGRYFLVRTNPPNEKSSPTDLSGVFSPDRSRSSKETLCSYPLDAAQVAQWIIPWRRPIFAAFANATTQSDGMPVSKWQFYLPQSSALDYSWLHEVNVDATINLIGPLGNGFQLDEVAQRLLVLIDSPRALTMLALIEEALNQGKKVAVLVRGEGFRAALLPRLPITVEVHSAEDEASWQVQVVKLLKWTDQVCAAPQQADIPALSKLIKNERPRLPSGFAQVLVEADLLCGVGACLACVIPLAGGGLTRACVHGPVMDLREMA